MRFQVIYGSHFVWAKNNGGNVNKARPRENDNFSRKRHMLDSVGAVKLFARLTELMSATLGRAVAIFCSPKKAQTIVTLPL